MASDKKRSIPSSVLWGGLGIIILLLGAGSALFYYSRSQEDGAGAGIVQSVLGLFKSMAPVVGQAPEGERPEEPAAEPRTYTVREGDNLWAIARKGELVDSPWQWRNIVVQNKDKIDYAFVSEDTGDWKVMVDKGTTLEVTPPAPPDQSKPVKKKFALQLLSTPEPNLKRALGIVKMLLSDGYYAYLYRIEVKGSPFFRIRVGFFDSKEDATIAGTAIRSRYEEKKIFPAPFMVFLPSFREMRGERLDFGAQKSRPWVIEFPQRDSHEQALQDLKQVSPKIDFAYIAQKKDAMSGIFLYRTRVGFFPTAEKAKSVIMEQGTSGKGLWSKAKVTSLKGFHEALPGQQMKLNSPPRS